MTVTGSLVGHSGNAGLAGLRSSKSVQRLEQVANLRSRGIGDNIDLPQLVVCGDQSAGLFLRTTMQHRDHYNRSAKQG